MKEFYGRDGLHYFDRKTGINVLLDDVSIPEEQLSKAPKYVSIALTNACDLSCTYCYAPKSGMSLELNRLKGWLKELDKNGTLGVGFGGGEPFLYKYLVEICDFIYEETSLGLSVTTHGHRASKDILDSLNGKVNFFRLSMDGVYATYEEMRGRSFSNFLEKLQLVSRVANIGINYVVNEKTLLDLESAYEIAESYNASEFLLLPQISTTNSKGLSSEGLSRLREWVSSKKPRIQTSISAVSSEGFQVCETWRKSKAVESYLHIDANGLLKLSSFDDFGLRIGDEMILKKIDELKTMQEVV